MEIKTGSFKAILKTLSEKLLGAVSLVKKTTAGFSACLPRAADFQLWLSENAFIKDARDFSRNTYARLVVRRDYAKRDVAVFFILAVLLGIAFKAVATQTVTIGFEDYTLPPKETLYDLNAIQEDLIGRGGLSVSDGIAEGGACSE